MVNKRYGVSSAVEKRIAAGGEKSKESVMVVKKCQKRREERTPPVSDSDYCKETFFFVTSLENYGSQILFPQEERFLIRQGATSSL